jgi:hypothetical protein
MPMIVARLSHAFKHEVGELPRESETPALETTVREHSALAKEFVGPKGN